LNDRPQGDARPRPSTAWTFPHPESQSAPHPSTPNPQEHNDALAGLYLATLTRGLAALNDAVDRVAFAYESGLKPGGGGGPRRRGGGGGGFGGGPLM
jgi:hypothetical protein